MSGGKEKPDWFLAFSVVLSIWILVGWGILAMIPNLEVTSQIGDTFGIVNALFAGLAFAGIIITLWYQRKDLQQQLTESREQTRAFEEQVKVMHEQAETMKQQSELLKAQAEALQRQSDNLEKNQRYLELQSFDTAFYRILDRIPSAWDDLQFLNRKIAGQTWKKNESETSDLEVFWSMVRYVRLNASAKKDVKETVGALYDMLPNFYLPIKEALLMVDEQPEQASQRYIRLIRISLSPYQLYVLSLVALHSSNTELYRLLDKHCFFGNSQVFLSTAYPSYWCGYSLSSVPRHFRDKLRNDYGEDAFGQPKQAFSR